MILGVAPTRYRSMIDILDDSTSYCWDGLGEDVPKGLLIQVRRRDAKPSARQEMGRKLP
jgi:hypothetical protein